MARGRDISRFGWMIVGAILVWDGADAMWTREIYGRIHVPGDPPILQGWPVAAIGLVELIVGAALLYRMWRSSQ
ncbi:MAG: hypothetical protein P8X48_07335 [Acidiferrobacteraceae bacterium]